MAKKKGELLTGVLGPLVYRIVNGKQIVTLRIKKGTMKQTQNTKDVSNTFGVAAKFAANIRETLFIPLNGLYDDGMRNRLNGVVTKILDEARDRKSRHYHFEPDTFDRLNNFEFNINSIVADSTGIKPRLKLLDGVLTISVPQLKTPDKIKFTNGMIRCKLTFSVSVLSYKLGKMLPLAETQSLMVLKNEPLTGGTKLSFSVPEDCLYVVGMFLEFYTADRSGWKLVNNAEFSPGKIIGTGVSPGTMDGTDTRMWKKMEQLI